MDNFKNVIPLFVLLFICTLDGYSMMNYRVTAKRAYICFASITALCLAINSYVVVTYGSLVLRNVIIFTIGLPYFALILFISGDKISKTVFNFWLWINVYEIIANFTTFINDFTFRNYYFLTAIRFVLFCVYFVVYNKFLKKKHKVLMEILDVNWWIFSFIPMFFTVLICLVNYYSRDFHGMTRNYPVLITLHTLMLLVYILMFYTFKTAYDSMERERLAQSMKKQVALQKKQHEFYLQKEETERIFRHDARHRDTILMSYLEKNDIQGAKAFINKELDRIHTDSQMIFCENPLVNAVISEYSSKAQLNGTEFTANIKMPYRLFCDEAEFCVMLSNLLENSFDSAKSYVKINIGYLNNQISVNIKNDYDGILSKDGYGNYATTKSRGSGLGLKSVNLILKNNNGFLKINDENGVFDVFATMKNSPS